MTSTTFGDIVANYVETSSIVGVNRLMPTYSPVKRLSWFVLVVVGCVGTTLHASVMIAEFMKYPIQTTVGYSVGQIRRIQMSIDLVDMVDFPAVTVCNQNTLRMSAIESLQCEAQQGLASAMLTAERMLRHEALLSPQLHKWMVVLAANLTEDHKRNMTPAEFLVSQMPQSGALGNYNQLCKSLVKDLTPDGLTPEEKLTM